MGRTIARNTKEGNYPLIKKAPLLCVELSPNRCKEGKGTLSSRKRPLYALEVFAQRLHRLELSLLQNDHRSEKIKTHHFDDEGRPATRRTKLLLVQIRSSKRHLFSAVSSSIKDGRTFARTSPHLRESRRPAMRQSASQKACL